jgi:hypothetical protein
MNLFGPGGAVRRWLRGIPGAALAFLFLFSAILSFLGSLGVFGPEWRTTGTATAFYVSSTAGVAILGLRAPLSRSLTKALLVAAVAGLLVRLALAWVAPLNYDLQSYAIVLNALNHGEVVYQATDRYNYSPIWFNVLHATARLSQAVGLSPFFGFRLVTIAGDAGLALALYVFGLAGDTRRRAASRAIVLWTNPILIATSAFHGQFETIALALFVAALALVRRSGEKRATLLPALLVGTGIAVKQIVVVFLAGFLGFSKNNVVRIRDAILAVAPFLLLLVPYYFVAPAAIVNNVLRYSSLHGIWGWLYLVRLAGGGLPFPPVFVSYAAALLGGSLAFYLVRRGDDGLAASRLAALVFLALTPGWSPQMLVWPLAFAPDRRESLPAALYTLAGMGVYAELLRLHDANFIFMMLAWMAVLFWLVRAPRSRLSTSRVMVRHGK